MYDIVNEDRIDQELARIFRGVSKDARIARWLKKRGAAFLKSRVSDVIEVHPTSPGARNFPQWAMAKMAKDEPVFMFALGHGSLDQLTHVKDLFEALLDEEANQSPARKESAAKILNSLSQYDMVGAYWRTNSSKRCRGTISSMPAAAGTRSLRPAERTRSRCRSRPRMGWFGARWYRAV
ncbi:hypothetical protein [Salipiger sp. PrR003]|uniref:hypothetical protein n=1 Tax=Salipiger sp. PrR003 TaxID=2706776 RepID=UPI0013DB5DDA|nr:hypothetical protein [Salipiger sp. PrR003]NDV51483.1 hypothetical protein [Salipiger sp. PrR003]